MKLENHRRLENSFCYEFSRVNFNDADMVALNHIVDKYDAYLGYITFDMNNKKYLKGFIIFPIRMPVRYLCFMLPNFLINLVDDLNKIEDQYKTDNTIWKNHHPFKSIKTNLMKFF